MKKEYAVEITMKMIFTIDSERVEEVVNRYHAESNPKELSKWAKSRYGIAFQKECVESLISDDELLREIIANEACNEAAKYYSDVKEIEFFPEAIAKKIKKRLPSPHKETIQLLIDDDNNNGHHGEVLDSNLPCLFGMVSKDESCLSISEKAASLSIEKIN